MSRFSLLLSIVFLVACCSVASTQELPPPPRPLRSTPEVLKQVAEARQVIEKLPNEEKVTAQFRLLSLLVRFNDKSPARETMAEILKFVPGIEKELTRQQLLEAIAYTQADIGDYEDAFKTVDRMDKLVGRANCRLNIAERMLAEKDVPIKPGDMIPVLRKGVAEAVEAKNAGLETVGRAVLGWELGRSGKTEEAKTEFAAALKKSGELEAVEGRNAVALITRSEIRCGLIPEALAVLEMIDDEETKQGVTGYAVMIMFQESKIDEANKLLDSIPKGEYRDNVLVGIVRETATTATVQDVLKLAVRLSEPDRKDLFVQSAVRAFFENDRLEPAAEMATHLENPDQIAAEIRVRQLEKLLGDKKFDEAQKQVDGFEDGEVRRAATRYVLMTQLKEGNLEKVQKLAETIFTDEDRQQLEQLRVESEKIAEIDSADERMTALSEILKAQFGLFDLLGSRKTLDKMLQTAEGMTDPALSVGYRMELTPLQVHLCDMAGIKKNLRGIIDFLDGIKDLKKLEKLVPPSEDGPSPPTEETIKDRLFELYLTVADGLGNAEDMDGAMMAFQKAKTLADAEPNDAKKSEMLLLLSQLIAELETPETEGK